MEVWKTIKYLTVIGSIWGEGSLENSFHTWFTNEDKYKFLPIFISWSIWILRNLVVFQDYHRNALLCIIRGLNLFKEYEKPDNKGNAKKGFWPTKVTKGVVGYFDGSSNHDIRGCGILLFLSKEHLLQICLGGSLGSNTKDEHLILYGLLFTSSHLGVSDISIFGDSKIIID